MIKISNTTKKIIFMMISLDLIFFGVGSLFSNNIPAFFMGFLLGGIFSALKLILIEVTLSKAIGMPSDKAVMYSRLHFTLRYILTGAVLLIAALRQEDISLFAVIISLILLVPATYIVSFKESKLKGK